jgi:hypothetical protein
MSLKKDLFFDGQHWTKEVEYDPIARLYIEFVDMIVSKPNPGNLHAV